MSGTDPNAVAPPSPPPQPQAQGGMPFGMDPGTIQALQQRAQQMLQSQVQSPWQQAFGRWATSPVTGALMGAASGFGQAAMPTPYRMPFGAVLGMGMQGMQTGMQNAYRSQQEQAQAQMSQLQAAGQMAQMPGTMALANLRTQLATHPEMIPGWDSSGVGVTPPTMPQPPAAAGGGAIARDTSVPTVGQQANNPGNVMADNGLPPGAIGYIPASGGTRKVAAYPDLPTGIAANAANLAAYQTQHGINTVRGAVTRWVNDPNANLDSYIGDVSKALGVGPDDKIDLTDPTVQQKFILAQQPHETGKAWFTPNDVAQGVALAHSPQFGATSSGPPQNAGDAWNRYMQLNAQASRAELFKTLGLPTAVDPAALRAQALEMLKFATAGPQAASVATATAPIEIAKTLAQQGWRQNQDGTYSAIPGGPADPNYKGSVAGAEAGAKLPADLIAKGWKLDANGNPVPTAGGPNDPTYKAMVAASEQAAKDNVHITITRDGSVFQGPHRIGGMQIDTTPGSSTYGSTIYQPAPANAQPAPTTAANGQPGASVPPGSPAAPIVTKLGPGQTRRAEQQENVQAEAYNRDQTDSGHLLDEGNEIQTRQMALAQMRSLVDQLPQTGSGGGSRASIANFVQTYIKPLPGVGPLADSFLSTMGRLPDAALSQELAKLTTQAAGMQEKGAVGARGSLGLTELFLKNNPGLETQPDANRMMVSLLQSQAQMNLDYIRGMHDWMSAHGQNYLDGKGYVPVSEFDRQWLNTDHAQLYSAAASALGGRSFADWTKPFGGDEAKIAQALAIARRISPGAPILMPDGKPWTFSGGGG